MRDSHKNSNFNYIRGLIKYKPLRKTVNSIVGIGFSFVFLYYLMGDFIIFKATQYSIKQEAISRLRDEPNNNELVLIKVASSSPDKKNFEENEFYYRHKWLDVVKKIKKEDTTYLYCFDDTKETILTNNYYKKVESTIDNSSSGAKDISNHPLKKTSKRYFFNVKETDYALSLCGEINSYYHFRSIEKYYFEFPAPPPRQIG
jgi:hypothetical protein